VNDEQEHSLNRWFLVAVWIVGTTIATFYAESEYPAAGWYDWPLIWVGAFVLTGIALTVVYGVTVMLHDFWWNHLRGRVLPWRRQRLSR
jgi:hypothetical protein